MTPDAEARLLRDLGTLVRGESQRSREITELTAAMRAHEARDEERHQHILDRLRALETSDKEVGAKVNEITGKHQVSEQLKAEVARREAEERAAEAKKLATTKEVATVQRDWVKFAVTPVLTICATIAVLVISRVLGFK